MEVIFVLALMAACIITAKGGSEDEPETGFEGMAVKSSRA